MGRGDDGTIYMKTYTSSFKAVVVVMTKPGSIPVTIDESKTLLVDNIEIYQYIDHEMVAYEDLGYVVQRDIPWIGHESMLYPYLV